MIPNLDTRYTKYNFKIEIKSDLPLLICIICECIDKVLFVLIFYVFFVSSEWAPTFSYVIVRRQTIQYIFWCHFSDFNVQINLTSNWFPLEDIQLKNVISSRIIMKTRKNIFCLSRYFGYSFYDNLKQIQHEPSLKIIKSRLERDF